MAKVNRYCVGILVDQDPVWSSVQMQNGEEQTILQNLFGVDELGSKSITFEDVELGTLYYNQKPSNQASKNVLASHLFGGVCRGNAYLLSHYTKSQPVLLTKDMYEKLKSKYCLLMGKDSKKTNEEKQPHKSKSALEFFSTEYYNMRKKEMLELKQTPVLVEIKKEAQGKWDVLSNEEKQKYVEQSEKDQVRFDRAFAEYTLNNPKMPKAPKTAYQVFCAKFNRLPGKRKETIDPAVPNWSTFSAEEKKEYQDLAELDKPRFEKEYAEYVLKCEAIGKTPQPVDKPRKSKNEAAELLEKCKAEMSKHGLTIPQAVQSRKRRKTAVSKPKQEKAESATCAAVETMVESSDDSDSDDED